MSTRPGIFPWFMLYYWCSWHTGKIFHVEICATKKEKGNSFYVMRPFAKVLDQYPSPIKST